MDVLVAFIIFAVGVLVGGLAVRYVTRLSMQATTSGDLAAAVAERDVLRERVVDLEATVTDDAQTAALLGPLREALTRVERQVVTLERDRVEQFSSVDVALKHVTDSTEQLRRETSSLAGSLNASSVRGQWGEAQLRRILELSGMLRHCDFDEQWRGTNDAGSDIRPDVVVHLPGERHLVIDAKAPLSAFLAAQNPDTTENSRTANLDKHARQLRGHVETLSGKRYWTALDSPSFVICFVPGDAVLGAALNRDPALLEDAMARHVILASPSTLLATLRSVAAMWQQENLEANARELLTLGRELYDRIGVLAKHGHDLGASLRRSVEAYNLFVGSLESRVLVTARKLRDLDVSPAAPPTVNVVDTTPRLYTHEELLRSLDDDGSANAPSHAEEPSCDDQASRPLS